MKADSFFSPEEKTKIMAAINEIEQKTAGEVAVMVVDRSDTYPEAEILAGILLGGLLALLITDIFWADSLWIFAPVTVLLAFLLGWTTRLLPAVKRLFVPAARLEQQVEQRALRAFYEKGLYKTRDDTGVLFFISLFEHRVWVLADEGIYGKITPAELQEYAADVAAGVKSGRAAEMLCKEIRRVGLVLAHHFPIKDNDTNELPDEIIIG